MSASLIPMPRGQYAIVDREDRDSLAKSKWSISNGRYVARNAGSTELATFMHRAVLGLRYRDGRYADHINHNTLDNRKSNLRICNCSQNNGNMRPKNHSSKYKGVSWFKAGGNWTAQIKVNYKKIHLGYFKDEWSAAEAYNKKALELFGEFALLNGRS